MAKPGFKSRPGKRMLAASPGARLAINKRMSTGKRKESEAGIGGRALLGLPRGFRCVAQQAAMHVGRR